MSRVNEMASGTILNVIGGSHKQNKLCHFKLLSARGQYVDTLEQSLVTTSVNPIELSSTLVIDCLFWVI